MNVMVEDGCVKMDRKYSAYILSCLTPGKLVRNFTGFEFPKGETEREPSIAFAKKIPKVIIMTKMLWAMLAAGVHISKDIGDHLGHNYDFWDLFGKGY